MINYPVNAANLLDGPNIDGSTRNRPLNLQVPSAKQQKQKILVIFKTLNQVQASLVQDIMVATHLL